MKNTKLQPIKEYKSRPSIRNTIHAVKQQEILNKKNLNDDSQSKKSFLKIDSSINTQSRSNSKLPTNKSNNLADKKLFKGISKNVFRIPDKSSISNESSEKLTNPQITFKEMIENASIDQKLFSLLEDTHELINEKSVEKRKSEQERYELIDKDLLETLKKTNEDLKIETKKLSDNYNEIMKKLKNLNIELAILNNTMNRNDKNKSNYINKTFQLEENYKDLLLENHRLNEMVHKEIVEKENIFRALVSVTNKNRNKLPLELKEVYDKINHDYYKNPYQVDNTNKLEVLRNKIISMEKELNEKKMEAENKKEIVRQIIERSN